MGKPKRVWENSSRHRSLTRYPTAIFPTCHGPAESDSELTYMFQGVNPEIDEII